MSKKSEAMYQIRSISTKLERERARLKKAYNERTIYTVKYNASTNPKHSAKYADRIEEAGRDVHDIKKYVDDLLTDLKYQLDQYATEIDKDDQEYLYTISGLQ